MEIGSKVKHRLSSQIMTITRLNKTVATCKLEVPVFVSKSKYFKEHYNEIAICQIINLELI